MAFSNACWLALTVPKIAWFFKTMLRIKRSVSTWIGALRPGTPVNTNTPLVPSTFSASKARLEAPTAS